MLNVTSKAVEKLKEILDYPNKNVIRLYIAGVGWGGPSYGMALAETIEEHDDKVEVEGIQFIYNNGLSSHMADLTINYKKSWAGEGFQVYREGVAGC